MMQFVALTHFKHSCQEIAGDPQLALPADLVNFRAGEAYELPAHLVAVFCNNGWGVAPNGEVPSRIGGHMVQGKLNSEALATLTKEVQTLTAADVGTVDLTPDNIQIQQKAATP